MEKNCYNCFNFIAKIPVTRGATPLEGRIDYRKATATCREGLLTGGTGNDRIFKNVLRGKISYLAAYNQAERCPAFETD